ncbi:hypothetical protein BN159_6248 [Streptomyces davaonensis JCM 4913]|uniref:Orc1-like AAA ATPase domain-containing protein n=1 Tax=Streptomyces davaonensis (strain DSM 101723 / JCM 4913 / KCC S-0913 / 768) TaxID=1214101 RepID=K4RBG0_STRDJ|nr:ATP-binding protein [Streptomyces davaonensis]CCK30627.1 hypothetical protein BN159_6248 [Streptomyces davaonensis JCM 4913]
MSEQGIQGTVLGVVVQKYKSGNYPELPRATEQLTELCTLLEGYGYTPTVVQDPGRDSLKASVESWREGWEENGSHGPAIVVWSGHGVLRDEGELRLVVHDTRTVDDEEQTYSARLLTSAALRSRADQVLMLIDTCHAGAGVIESLQKALSTWSARSLPEGRAAWLGVVASCRPREKAEGRGLLLDTVVDVLRNGPRTKSYRHRWSPRNWQVTGADVVRAALDQWPEDEGQRPVPASLGQELPMFRNPHKEEKGEPELVEHLVRAAAGADRVEEGWFFTGRRRVLGEIVDWLEAREPGLFLVTGSAGSGKSAVLGRVATLSDRRHRADIVKHEALREGDPDPGVDSVDVALHLRGLTVQQVAEAIARRLGLGVPDTPAELIADVERELASSDRPTVLLLDGLDEAAAEQAGLIVEQLLAPLSRMTCILLASRDRPFNPEAAAAGEPLDEAVSRLLGIRARAAGLDGEADTGEDIREYARRRLHVTGLPGEAADLIARRAATGHGGFLYAQMAVDSVIRHVPEEGAEGWESSIPVSISAAFNEHLAAGPQLERNGEVVPLAAQELLTALSWGTGNGMPARGVWETAATALSTNGTVYDREHVDWLLNSYGRYVVEDTDGVQAVYRLYHREFIEHLRESSSRERGEGQPEPAYLVARGLVDLLRQQSDEAAVLEHANPYLRGSLAEHAVMAGGRGIALVRELVELREQVFQPDLAMALTELARMLSEAGLREAALAPSQEAVDLYRTLAEANPAAYLPDLATSLNNLAIHQSETGDRTGALTTINEAVTIRRTLAKANPAAYLPNLAGSLNNLAVHQSETGDRTGALTTINEAVTIRRTLAKANPAAYLPDLATSLNNLANRQSETGDRTGALTTINEAVTIRRTLAKANPAAYLPDLAMSLNNLADIASTDQTLAAFAQAEESLARHPQAARQITVQRAEFQLTRADSAAGVSTLIDLLLTPLDGLDPVASQARHLLRNFDRATETGTAQVRTAWRRATGTEPPAWLSLAEAAFALAITWIQCPTWISSRTFWDEHAAELQSPETTQALEELALAHEAAQQHLHIARAAAADTPDAAFRPYLTREFLGTWMDCPAWEESQTYLADHGEYLLHDESVDQLANDQSAEAAAHWAVVLLARAEGIPTAYTYIEARTALNDRIQRLLAAPDAVLLNACALLELLVHQDEFTATVHLAMSAVLSDNTYAPDPWPTPTQPDRDRALTEITTLMGHSPQHAQALSALLQTLLTITPE